MCTYKYELDTPKARDESRLWTQPKQFREIWEKGGRPKQFVKCGKCYECKKERARNWQYKIWLESLEHKEKCFITLTYKDNLNGKRQVSKRNVQLFMKKLREHIKPKKIKYFAAGEYGEKKGRPHYHIIILGWQPKDLKKMRNSNRNNRMFKSKTVEELWGYGIVSVQDFGVDEVGYLTLYLNKNEYINEKINQWQIWNKKRIINEVKENQGISIKTYDKKGNIRYEQIKAIKDLTKEELKDYKKTYNEAVANYEMKLEPEFNLYSQGMGFDSYIKRKYYKYDLILDSYHLERPIEYLRKVLDKPENYSNEVYEETVKRMLERKEYVEMQLDIDQHKTRVDIRNEERQATIDNKNQWLKGKKYTCDF